MKPCQSGAQIGFNSNSLHTLKEPHAVFYLKQRASFFIAAVSLFTFLIGNMVGQHGWYTFWASVLGQEDHTQIAYVGTVSPLENIVDYECWAEYGGDYKVHTFRQAPTECHRDSPQYTSSENRHTAFSMQYMSSYDSTTEASGTHSGVDVRVPTGTPARSVMNGIVESVGNQPNGFGKYVVIKHPNVPDVSNPSETTTLYSTYAHLSATYVAEGDIISKGDMIALTGSSGKSTGPHLHFSLDRDDVPYVPYYPSNMADGYKYTINPMLYVQSNFAPVREQSVIVANAERRKALVDHPHEVVAPRRVATRQVERTVATPDPEPASRASVVARLQARRAERVASRLAARESRTTVALTTGLTSTKTSAPEPRILSESHVVSATTGLVSSVEISHDGSFTGLGWEKVRITLLDADGNKVTDPAMDHDIKVVVDFGTARVQPPILSSLDFEDGEAVVHVLGRGRRAILLKVLPFGVTSTLLKFER